MAVSKRIVLHFPKRLVDQPIVSRLVKDFELDFNTSSVMKKGAPTVVLA